MTRTLPALNLTKSPLVLVLAQIRFASVLLMPKYIPAIQDRLRKNGYPIERKVTTQEVIFGPGGAATPIQTERWAFQNKASTLSIIVANNFVVLETSDYSTFEDFVEKLSAAVDTVAEEVEALVIERIGLRYVDLVRPSEGKTWQDYLHRSLHGLQSDQFSRDSQVQLLQSTAQTAHGTMIVRVLQNRDGKYLPPDLIEDTLKPKISTSAEAGELLTLVDLDHFSTNQEDYSQGFVTQTVWSLHDTLDHLFRESIATEAALKEWE